MSCTCGSLVSSRTSLHPSADIRGRLRRTPFPFSFLSLSFSIMKYRPVFDGLPAPGEAGDAFCSTGYRIQIAAMILASSDPDIVRELSKNLNISPKTLRGWAATATRALERAFADAEPPDPPERRRGRPKGSVKPGSKRSAQRAAREAAKQGREASSSAAHPWNGSLDPNQWYEEQKRFVEKLLARADQALGSADGELPADVSPSERGLVPREKAKELAARIRSKR